MSCKLDIPLRPSTRDPSLEADLQSRIEDGHKIYVMGDIHGHLATFRALLHRLNLGPEDRLICLGDMIDRGTDSAGVIKLIRSDKRIICIKGNHEQMAIQSITKEGKVELYQPWIKRGGKSTWGSYILQAEGDLYLAKRTFYSDAKWMDGLPTQIVLDNWRFVHAGYDPRMPLDSQGEKELLWIRKIWYNHESPVDPKRTIVFGHTTTTKVGKVNGGDIAYSTFDNNLGNPAWIAMDVCAYNHVSPGLAALDIQTLQSIKQHTLRADKWFEVDNKPIKFSSKKHNKKGRWKHPDNRKESLAADSFGLIALQARSKRNKTAEKKARNDLNKIGITIPSKREQMKSERSKSFTWRKLARRAKQVRQNQLPNRDEWLHNGRVIRLGPGTNIDRIRPYLPGPTSFTVFKKRVNNDNHIKNFAEGNSPSGRA